MLTNDSVGSNRALKRYSRHRRQRTDCCYKRAAERRSLSRPCRPSKYLAGLTCSDPGTAPKSMAPRGDVWPTQPDRLMQELEGTEALRALRCERFLSSSPSLLPLVLTQSSAEYSLPGLSAPAAAPAPSGSVHGYVPINFSQNLRGVIGPSRQAILAPPLLDVDCAKFTPSLRKQTPNKQTSHVMSIGLGGMNAI